MKRSSIGLLGFGYVLGISCLSFGCDDPIERAQDITRSRVLAARSEASQEPSRATPRPGEAVSVRWLVASPDPQPRIGAGFSACMGADWNSGTGDCLEAPFALANRSEVEGSELEFTFELPETWDAVAHPRIHLEGTFCAGSEATESGACTGGQTGLRAVFDLNLETPEFTNQNPAFEEPAILLDGAPWLAAPEPFDCGSALVPQLAADATIHELEIRIDAGSREPVSPVLAEDPTRESILVSHFASAGSLDRPFSRLSWSEENTGVRVPWSAPATVEAPGTRAHFWIVLRDERGGTAYIERSVCLIP
ncbi:MAG TPA: hypothetical protein VFQ61_04405 [Polyangiaceae bacterium]|nr:hypothetical protein [Polyangiaceae bacterium]